MSSQSKQDSDDRQKASASQAASSQGRLPFEPGQNRQKSPKKSAQVPAAKAVPASATKADQPAQRSAAVPDVVSRRMARRMAFFCGIPTSLGMLTFIISYIIVTQHWFKLPNAAVVLVSMGFFGLGVLGLTYGVLSASWDEDRAGSLMGWSEFTVNFGRLTESWRSARQKPDA